MLTPTFFIVSITMIISLFYYKKFNKTIYKYFIAYLFFTFIVEFLNNYRNFYLYLTEEVLYRTNPIYNTYAVITFVFYLLFYKSLFKNKRNKLIMNLFLLLYLLFIPFDFFILKTDFYYDFFVNNIIFGAILLIVTLILFLIEIVNSEDIIFNIKKSFIFWISIGVLLFYIGSTPIIISSKYLEYRGLFQQIITGLNLIMYGSFIFGFIKSDKKYNY